MVIGSGGSEEKAYPPGDLAIWIFILAELTAFFALFVTYATSYRLHHALFAAMQPTLDPKWGAANTLLLLLGSWAVARAVLAAEESESAGEGRRAARWLFFALFCGCAFLVSKGMEYAAKFRAGIDLDTNLFYTFYFSLTAFHAMHVALGVVILAIVAVKAARGAYTSGATVGLESAASYWHMVDLVWLILFPLLYLFRIPV